MSNLELQHEVQRIKEEYARRGVIIQVIPSLGTEGWKIVILRYS